MIKEDGSETQYISEIINCYINQKNRLHIRLHITLTNGKDIYGTIVNKCDSGMLEMQTDYGKSYFTISDIVSLTELFH